MAEHYNITVQGKVQGVFFRASTQREATSLGLAGFVRNESNGIVYIEVEGEQHKIDQLLHWISLGGPPQGVVNDYECVEGELKNFRGFEIR